MIQMIFDEHFQKIFTSIAFDPLQDASMEVVKQVVPKKVVPCESIILSRELELDELDTAIRKLKNNKSPGLDGLIVEFYKQMWHAVGPTYFKMCQEAIQCGGC
jgi:hypothetical protein